MYTTIAQCWRQMNGAHGKSGLKVRGSQTGRLVEICRALGGTRYLSGAASREYLDVAVFEQAGIEVQFQDYQHPTYIQAHGSFVPYLSALDLVANVVDSRLSILRAGRRFVPAT